MNRIDYELLVEDRAERRNGHLYWTGATSGDGYPKMMVNGKVVSLRKRLWEIIYGVPLPRRYVVSSICGDKMCIQEGCIGAVLVTHVKLMGRAREISAGRWKVFEDGKLYPVRVIRGGSGDVVPDPSIGRVLKVLLDIRALLAKGDPPPQFLIEEIWPPAPLKMLRFGLMGLVWELDLYPIPNIEIRVGPEEIFWARLDQICALSDIPVEAAA